MAKKSGMTVSGFPKFKAMLSKLGAAGPAAGAGALYREGERIMTTSKRDFVPTDLGPLRASGHVVPPDVQSGRLVVVLAFGGAASEYAVYVHEGTGPAVGRPPFMPPPEALEGWAKRHGIPEENLFALARAIGRKGLTPTKYLETPLLEAARDMDKRLAADVRRDLERLGR